MLLANKIQQLFNSFFNVTLTLGYYVTFDSLNAKHRTKNVTFYSMTDKIVDGEVASNMIPRNNDKQSWYSIVPFCVDRS